MTKNKRLKIIKKINIIGCIIGVVIVVVMAINIMINGEFRMGQVPTPTPEKEVEQYQSNNGEIYSFGDGKFFAKRMDQDENFVPNDENSVERKWQLMEKDSEMDKIINKPILIDIFSEEPEEGIVYLYSVDDEYIVLDYKNSKILISKDISAFEEKDKYSLDFIKNSVKGEN